MANAVGLIRESIWRDTDFRSLPRTAQTMYAQLLSQKELDCAGMLPLQPEKWATGCDQLTVKQVWADLNHLQAARFVYYDTDTYELLVRTHIRNSNVLKVPNMRKSAMRSAALVASPALRAVLADEFVATGLPEFVGAAIELNPSITVPKPLTKPCKTLTAEPLANPSVTLAEPTGKGKGTGVKNLSTTQVGENARPACPKHVNGNPDDTACRGCMKVRQWDEQHAADLAADELLSKRLARERAEQCPACLGTNWIPDTDPAIKCDHQPKEETTA
jgi:hypothetical protein